MVEDTRFILLYVFDHKNIVKQKLTFSIESSISHFSYSLTLAIKYPIYYTKLDLETNLKLDFKTKNIFCAIKLQDFYQMYEPVHLK